MILLGKNPGLVTIHSNIQDSPGLAEEDYLLASVIKQAKLGNIQIKKDVCEISGLDENIDTQSSTSSSSFSSSTSDKNESERDGLIYIAGFLAKKHKTQYPHLGEYSHITKEAFNFHSYARCPSFIQNLSYGGLIEPSEEWKQQVFKMDKYFQKFHKDKFSVKKEIVKKTTEYICSKLVDIPKELVKSFSQQRMFIRIKFLNMKQSEEKQKKRKGSSYSSVEKGNKLIKKMKKIVN